MINILRIWNLNCLVPCNILLKRKLLSNTLVFIFEAEVKYAILFEFGHLNHIHKVHICLVINNWQVPHSLDIITVAVDFDFVDQVLLGALFKTEILNSCLIW